MKRLPWIMTEALIMNTGLPVDELPTDTSQHSVLYPVNVKADGNCLMPAAFTELENQNYEKEMRVKIIIEAVLNKSLYLSHDSLEQGLQKKLKKLAQTFTLYSDEYFSSNTLNEEEVEYINKREMMKIQRIPPVWEYGNFFSCRCSRSSDLLHLPL